MTRIGRGRAHRAGVGAAIALVVCLLAACSAIPFDTERTLERVTGGTLRVGVTHSPPWTEVTAGEPAGLEADLARAFADELDAEIAWTVDSEAGLVEAVHRGELDLLIGGFTGDTPWSGRAAVTAVYAEAPDSAGTMRSHVLLTRPGENAFLVRLEDFLADRGTS